MREDDLFVLIQLVFKDSSNHTLMAPLIGLLVASLTLILVKTLVELLSEWFQSPLEKIYPGPGPYHGQKVRAYSRLVIATRAAVRNIRTYAPAFSPSGDGISI